MLCLSFTRTVIILAERRKRRSFSNDVVADDAFYELSRDARLLYYSLGMDADDDGFLKSCRRICRVNEIAMDALDELGRQGYIIRFPSGVICIADWWRNNGKKKDRYKATALQEIGLVTRENGRYKLQSKVEPLVEPKRIQTVSTMEPLAPTTQEEADWTGDTKPSWMMAAFGKRLDKDEEKELATLIETYGAGKIKEGLDKLTEMRQHNPTLTPFDIRYLVSFLRSG